MYADRDRSNEAARIRMKRMRDRRRNVTPGLVTPVTPGSVTPCVTPRRATSDEIDAMERMRVVFNPREYTAIIPEKCVPDVRVKYDGVSAGETRYEPFIPVRVPGEEVEASVKVGHHPTCRCFICRPPKER